MRNFDDEQSDGLALLSTIRFINHYVSLPSHMEVVDILLILLLFHAGNKYLLRVDSMWQKLLDYYKLHKKVVDAETFMALR